MITNSGSDQTQWSRHCANFPSWLCQSISVWTTFTLESGAGQLCDSWGTWRGFFNTYHQGRISLWSISGCHGPVVSAAAIRGAGTGNYRRTQLGPLCLDPMEAQRRPKSLSLGFRGAETSGPE